MRELDRDFNKFAEVEQQRLEQDKKKLEADKLKELKKMEREHAEMEARAKQREVQTREDRIQAEAARLQKQAEDQTRKLKPEWALPPTNRAIGQNSEAAQLYRTQAERNIELREKQAQLARDEQFRRRVREYVDRALKDQAKAKTPEKTEAKSERMRKDMEKWKRRSARDDFDRER